MSKPSQSKQATSIALWLVALTPFFYALACFPLMSDTPLSGTIRFLAMPVILVECVVIVMALLSRGLPDARGYRDRLRWLIGIAILFALATLAALQPGDPMLVKMSIARTVIMAIHLGFFASLLSFLSTSSKHSPPFEERLLLGIGLYCVTFIVYAATKVGAVNFPWTGFGLGLTNIRQVSFYFGWAIPVALVLLLLSQDKRHQRMLFALLVVMLALTFWSGTRGVLVAAVGALGAIVIAGRWDLAVRGLAALLLAGLVAIPLSFIALPDDPNFGFLRIIGALSGETGDVSAGRLAMWREAVDLIGQRPWLGYGEDRYNSLAAEAYDRYRHPHNFLLQWAIQWGVPAALLAASLLGAALLNALARVREGNTHALVAWAGLSGLLTVALIEGALYHLYPTFMIATLLAYTLTAKSTR